MLKTFMLMAENKLGLSRYRLPHVLPVSIYKIGSWLLSSHEDNDYYRWKTRNWELSLTQFDEHLKSIWFKESKFSIPSSKLQWLLTDPNAYSFIILLQCQVSAMAPQLGVILGELVIKRSVGLKNKHFVSDWKTWMLFQQWMSSWALKNSSKISQC